VISKNEKYRKVLVPVTGLATVWAMIYFPFFILQESFISSYKNSTFAINTRLDELLKEPPALNCSPRPTNQYVASLSCKVFDGIEVCINKPTKNNVMYLEDFIKNLNDYTVIFYNEMMYNLSNFPFLEGFLLTGFLKRYTDPYDSYIDLYFNTGYAEINIKSYLKIKKEDSYCSLCKKLKSLCEKFDQDYIDSLKGTDDWYPIILKRKEYDSILDKFKYLPFFEKEIQDFKDYITDIEKSYQKILSRRWFAILIAIFTVVMLLIGWPCTLYEAYIYLKNKKKPDQEK
jgi:hypothetical protein